MKVLFLYLNAYSFVGGIQKFNQNFLKALAESMDIEKDQITALSLLDHKKDLQFNKGLEKHTSGRSKIVFLCKAVLLGLRSDTIVFGHINILFPLVLLFKVWGKKKLVLITHGIEIWKPVSFFKKMCLSKLDLIVTVSSFTEERIRAIHQIPKEKIKVLYNTLDPSFKTTFDQSIINGLKEKLQINSQDKLILTVCRLTKGEKYKGYDKVISVIPNLIKEFPTIKYVIAGKYDHEEKERITELIGRYNLEDRIILTGYVSDEELPALYSIADLFIMPSKKEGFGIVFLEALAYGKPVIGGNKDGSVDALQSGKFGLLVNPDIETEIEEAIKAVLNKKTEERYFDEIFLKEESKKTFGFERYASRVKELILKSE